MAQYGFGLAHKSNAAYDTSYAQEAQQRRSGLRYVQTDRRERIAQDRQLRMVLRSVALLLVVVVVSAVYLTSKVQLSALNDQITAAQEDLAAAQNASVRLELQMEGQLSMNNIEKYAEEMGLTKLQQYQVTCLTLNADDVITIQNTEQGFFAEIWDSLCGFFAGVGAYLGL